MSAGVALWIIGFDGNLVAGAAHAQPVQVAGQATAAPFPLAISPEGVQALAAAKLPFILIDADGPNVPPVDVSGPARRIYYTAGPYSRSAQNMVARDRKARPVTLSEIFNSASQRLTGTPLDWQRTGLKFAQSPLPAQPLTLSPQQLADTIKDGADVQIIDLRSLSGTDASPFPNAIQLLPHQVEGGSLHLSRQRWIVLVDGGGRVAQPIAERLFKQGFLLTAILAGGYPAWVDTVDR
jgi:rhodanese-related sulfurtransferase